jgi:subtilisin family serine protease
MSCQSNTRFFRHVSTSLFALAASGLMTGCISADYEDLDSTDADFAGAETQAKADVAGQEVEDLARRDDQSDLVGGKFRRTARPVGSQYIVTLSARAQGDADPHSARLAKAHRGDVRHVYRKAVRGFMARMSEDDALRMAAHPDVELVEEDGLISLDSTQLNATWGLDRIDSRSLSLDDKYVYGDNGAGVHAYVIDTGIRLTHSEFTGRIGGGYDAVTAGGDADDCNGHGTHVAGILGGTTYGVAKGVTLHPVRALGCGGGSTTSTVIAGVDWVADNFIAPAVVNMSLGGGTSSSLDNAVQGLINAGITVVVAAGNDAANACYTSPARLSAAITVGATDSDDQRAYFSNYGSCLDLFAPGTDIKSAYNSSNSSTATKSGTSMAAPHVAGAAAIYLQDHPSASPSDVASLLRNAAALDMVIDEGSGSPDRLLNIGFNSITIQAPSGHYFVAEGGGGGDVDANRSAAGPWEKFNLVDNTGGALTNGDFVFLQAYNGELVWPTNGGGSTLAADGGDYSAWESFRVWKLNGVGDIASGDTIALQGVNNMLVCAEGGGGGEVNVNRWQIGAWETLTINFVGW